MSTIQELLGAIRSLADAVESEHNELSDAEVDRDSARAQAKGYGADYDQKSKRCAALAEANEKLQEELDEANERLQKELSAAVAATQEARAEADRLRRELADTAHAMEEKDTLRVQLDTEHGQRMELVDALEAIRDGATRRWDLESFDAFDGSERDWLREFARRVLKGSLRGPA